MTEEIERVLVVNTSDVHSFFQTRGFIHEIPEGFLTLLREKAFFMDRSEAESNPEYRQIIPYVLVHYGGKFLTVKRLDTQTEKRLHNKASIGIGGHLNPVDGDQSEILDSGLRRELSEELQVNNPPGLNELKLMGLILSDRNEVSRVHMGIVLKWDVQEPVLVRETDKMDGEYLLPEQVGELKDQLETWSALVYDGVLVNFPSLNSVPD